MLQLLEKKIQKEKSRKIGSILFFIAFFGMISGMFLTATTYRYIINEQYIYRLEFILGIIASVKCLFFNRYKTIYSFISVISIGILFLSVALNSGSLAILYYYILIVAAKDIDYEKILIFFVVIVSLLLTITILSAYIGIIPDIIRVRDDSREIRYSLGTSYASDLAARVFYLWLAYTTVRKFNYNFPEYVIGICLSVLIYIVTDTKVDFLLILLTIIAVLLKKYIILIYRKLGKKVIAIASVVGILSSIILPYVYNIYHKNVIFSFLNALLTGRLHWGGEAFKRYNVTLFGQYIWERGNGGLTPPKIGEYFFIDVSYLRILMFFGIFIFFIIVGTIILLQIHYLNINSYSLITALILIMISSFIDHHMLEISYNFIFLSLLSNLDKYKNDSRYGIF